ncbi:MAG: copper chaperone PCu(A)C [Casimicrobiaceae bacterium]
MKRTSPWSRYGDGRILAIVGCMTLALSAAQAQGLFVVNQPWVRPAAAGHATEAYMNLTSAEGATLVGARADGAAAVSLRGPGTNATIREVALPPRTIVEFAPGKYQLWLRRLARSVRLGDSVALTLTIRGADGGRQDISVSAVARLRSPVDDERLAHRHRH